MINWLPQILNADGTSAYLPDTRKVWSLRPPADQAYVGEITLIQRLGDVIYLPPSWWHRVSLAPFLLPMPSSPNDVRVFWQVQTYGGLERITKSCGRNVGAAVPTVVAVSYLLLL